MATKKAIMQKQLTLPVICKCANCNKENMCTISFNVTGEGIYGGSPFGRQERAQQEAEANLKQNMRFHIKKLYEESDDEPERFVRYFKEDKCVACGQKYPWKDIEGAVIEDSNTRVKAGLLPSLLSLSSKKFKAPKKDVIDIIRAIPKENLPHPAIKESELVEQLGLGGVKSEAADMTALFMH